MQTHAHTRICGHTRTTAKNTPPCCTWAHAHRRALTLQLFCFHSNTVKRQLDAHTHSHTHTRAVHRVIISPAVGSSLGFIMWKQCPRSVSLRTMTWWSEVSEGRGSVPAERLLLMDDNKPSVRMERRTLKPPSFMSPCHLNCLARLTHWGSVTQARDNPTVMDTLAASASSAERRSDSSTDGSRKLYWW